MRNFIRRLLRSIKGHPCDRCGALPTKLVVDAVRTGKRLDGKTGLVTKTFRVNGCEFLCPKCRETTDGSVA